MKRNHGAVEKEIWVTFESDDDPEDPHNWSPLYKWSLTVLISTMSLIVNLAILMSAPATPEILKEFGFDNSLYGTLLVSIWELGEVFGPLVAGPLSEMYGRAPVYHVTTILFVIFLCVAAKSTGIDMLIAGRFLLGMNVSSVVLNPCIVGDMFPAEQRGRALSVMGMVPYVAPCLGPVIGGLVSNDLGWRWTFWLLAIVTGSLELLLLLLFRETYRPIILKRKAKKLQKKGVVAKVKHEIDLSGEESEWTRFRRSMVKPFTLFFTIPVLPLLSIPASAGMSLCYVVITSLTDIFTTTYGFSEATSGLSYMGLGLGMVTGVAIGGIILDKLYNRKGDLAQPEGRLPVMAFSYLLVPLGLLVFGWTAQPHIHWIVPIIVTFMVGFGFTAVTLASWAYLIDAFGVFAASATASVTVVRNAASASLPLVGPPLKARLGLGLGFTVLALVGFALSPVAFLLVHCGSRLRRVKDRTGQILERRK